MSTNFNWLRQSLVAGVKPEFKVTDILIPKPYLLIIKCYLLEEYCITRNYMFVSFLVRLVIRNEPEALHNSFRSTRVLRMCSVAHLHQDIRKSQAQFTLGSATKPFSTYDSIKRLVMSYPILIFCQDLVFLFPYEFHFHFSSFRLSPHSSRYRLLVPSGI